MPEKIETELLDNFLVVWDPEQGSGLYKLGYYGKPLGIPKPKIPEFDVPLILDLMEGLYLVEIGEIRVYGGPERKGVGFSRLRRRARRLYEDFDAKYAVYRDLRGQELIVTPGIKFGCDFAVLGFEVNVLLKRTSRLGCILLNKDIAFAIIFKASTDDSQSVSTGLRFSISLLRPRLIPST